MMRSHAYALAANGAKDDEVRAAITPATREDLETALESVMLEMRGAEDVQVSGMVGTIVGLVGADWSPIARSEFIAIATAELMSLPGGLVLDALARARRRVTAGRQLVAWVCDDVEPKAERLKVECDHLVRLANLAVPAA